MSWLAGGLIYACVFLYVASTVLGLALALFAHLFILALLGLLGLIGLKLLRASASDPEESPPKDS